MTYRGHVKNGQIALDEPAKLPEGAAVSVEVIQEPAQITRPQQRRRLGKFEPIQMPGGSLAEELVRDRR